MPDDITGVFIGYDPGGNGAHGFARLVVERGRINEQSDCETLRTAKEVVQLINNEKHTILGIGVDTLTCWNMAEGGWRPADCWLRKKYAAVKESVVAPNSLRGAMILNGMSVLIYIREHLPRTPITETHPKVLYSHYSKRKYNYVQDKKKMDILLSKLLGFDIEINNEHEWDACLSAYAAWRGAVDQWSDLHAIAGNSEEMVKPCGETNFYWPTTGD